MNHAGKREATNQQANITRLLAVCPSLVCPGWDLYRSIGDWWWWWLWWFGFGCLAPHPFLDDDDGDHQWLRQPSSFYSLSPFLTNLALYLSILLYNMWALSINIVVLLFFSLSFTIYPYSKLDIQADTWKTHENKTATSTSSIWKKRKPNI